MKKIEDILPEEIDAEVELRMQEFATVMQRNIELRKEISQLKRYKRTGKKPGEV